MKLAKDDQRITSLGLAAGSVAHDFDNALTAIVSHAALVRAQSKEPETVHHAEAILRATRVASQVVERVRRLLRTGPPATPVRVDLRRVIDEALVVSAVRARMRGVALRFLPPAEELSVVIDLAEVQQALSNLVNNAVEAARAEVRVEVESPQPEFAGVTVRIEDDGPGIPPSRRDEVFDPLFTTRDGGTGLGLPLAKQIIEAHGGRLELADSVLGGLRVEARLPTLSDTTGYPPPRPITDFELESTAATGRVLVIDDDKETREALIVLFAAAGFETAGADSAQEALLSFQRARPDLVVTDLQLGDTIATHLIERLSVLDPTIPIIVVSGLLATERPRSLRGRISASFDKPVSPGRLVDSVRQLMAERHALNRHHRTPS